MRTERRKHYDPIRHEPFAPVIGQCRLVQLDSLTHAYLVHLGWEELDRCEPDAVLMRQPRGFVVSMPEADRREFFEEVA